MARYIRIPVPPVMAYQIDGRILLAPAPSFKISVQFWAKRVWLRQHRAVHDASPWLLVSISWSCSLTRTTPRHGRPVFARRSTATSTTTNPRSIKREAYGAHSNDAPVHALAAAAVAALSQPPCAVFEILFYFWAGCIAAAPLLTCVFRSLRLGPHHEADPRTRNCRRLRCSCRVRSVPAAVLNLARRAAPLHRVQFATAGAVDSRQRAPTWMSDFRDCDYRSPNKRLLAVVEVGRTLRRAVEPFSGPEPTARQQFSAARHGDRTANLA
jgi:hypothetical protein